MESNASRTHPVDASYKRTNSILAAVAALLTLAYAVHLRAALTHNNIDMGIYNLNWYWHIVTYGRWDSLEASYANYSPPYLYVLSFTSLLKDKFSPLSILKLSNLPGLIAAALLFWSICRKLGCSHARSLLAAWLVLVAPEVFQNAMVWGQVDIFHTACLLGVVRLLLAKRPYWAMMVFGMALAFKLQAIFAGATIAALFLSGEVPWLAMLCVPMGYVLMMVPAWLAGRPWSQLLLIYAHQFKQDPALGMNVANPYELLTHYASQYHRVHAAMNDAGLLIAGIATLWLLSFLAKSPWRLRGERLILSMAAALLMEPYVLPKMHDRYFYAGDVMVLLLAMVRPGLWLPTALLQISALWVAYPFLFENYKYEPTAFFIVPVLLTTVSLLWVGRLLLKDEEQSMIKER